MLLLKFVFMWHVHFL